MTDARLKCEWFGRIDMDDLSDAAWRIFTGALMWSNLNGTDGWIPERYVDRLHPGSDRAVAAQAWADLVSHGLIVKGRDENQQKGVQLTDWAGALGQSTAEEMGLYKANAAKRAAKYRDSQKAKLAKVVHFTEPVSVTRDETSDVTSDVRAHVGKGKGKGTVIDTQIHPRNANQHTGEVEGSEVLPGNWNVTQPGSGGLVVNGKCVGCDWPADVECTRPHTDPEQGRINSARSAAA